MDIIKQKPMWLHDLTEFLAHSQDVRIEFAQLPKTVREQYEVDELIVATAFVLVSAQQIGYVPYEDEAAEAVKHFTVALGIESVAELIGLPAREPLPLREVYEDWATKWHEKMLANP